jgi:hypothetical protein
LVVVRQQLYSRTANVNWCRWFGTSYSMWIS